MAWRFPIPLQPMQYFSRAIETSQYPYRLLMINQSFSLYWRVSHIYYVTDRLSIPSVALLFCQSQG